MGFTPGLAIGADGPAVIRPNRMRGSEGGFTAGLRLGATQKRQLALVGPDAEHYRFTPEMTEGGSEGDTIVQHVARPPTWEDPAVLLAAAGSVWLPLTTVVGGQVDLVIDDNDSLVPTLVPLEDI